VKGDCRYPEDRVPRIQVLSQDKRQGDARAHMSQGPGSCLPTWGSSGAAACPRGSGSRLPARGRHVSPRLRLPSPGFGAATRRPGSSTRLLAQCSSEAVTCPEDGLYKLQAIKQISLMTRLSWSPSGRVHVYLPRHYATRAAPRVRKACSRWPIKYRRYVWADRSQWFATVLSGSPTLDRQRGQAGS
jgi:hypothetical protein